MKYVTVFITPILLFFSCKEKVRYEMVEVPSLSVKAIYDQKQMRTFVNDHPNNESIATSYFARAEEMYQKMPSKGIYLVKRAITIFPKQEYYRTLAAYCIATKKYEEGRQVLQYLLEPYVEEGTSVYPFDKPSKEMVFEYYQASVLSSVYISPADIEFYTVQTGVTISEYKELLLSSKLLSVKKDSWMYKNIDKLFLEEGITKEYLKGPENFKDIVASIAEISGSYEIDEARVAVIRKRTEYLEEIGELAYNYNLPNVQGLALFTYEYQARGSNEGENDEGYDYECNFGQKMIFSPTCLGLIYSKDTSAAGCLKEMRHVTHMMVLYSPQAQLKDHLVLAWQSGEALVLAKINVSTAVIEQKAYHRNWEKPYRKAESDNRYEGKEWVATQRYKIDPVGCKLEEELVDERSKTDGL